MDNITVESDAIRGGFLKFEWDENKNKLNTTKHNISFERAKTVFNDKNAIYMHDVEHSAEDDRFVVIGRDELLMELTVCHCYRGNDEEIIRLISARKATKNEVSLYTKGGVE